MTEIPQGEGSDVTESVSSGPLDLLLPIDRRIWEECRRMVVDKTVRVDDLATAAAQDPIIVLDLLRVSNAMFFAGGRAAITSVKTAIVRLGSEVVLDILEKLKGRTDVEDPDIRKWFETYRSKGRRCSIVAKILAETLARNLSDDSQAGGLLVYVGEMLAVAYLQDEYVHLAEEHSRAGVNYQLVQRHSFDVERMGVDYLRRYGIPEDLLFAIDREARSKTPDRAALRPIVLGAVELVEAFDSDRWEKFAPGAKLPPKSNIRMLQIGEAQYLKVYERCSEFLFAMRLAESRLAQESQAAPEVTKTQAGVPMEPEPQKTDSFTNEIDALINNRGAEVEEETVIVTTEKPATPIREAYAPKANTEQFDPGDQFSLGAPKEKSKPRTIEPPRIVKPQLRTNAGNAIVTSICGMFDNAQSSEELLLDLLSMLTDKGPFKQAALIVVSKDRRHAIVVAQRGSKYGNGQKLELDDPLSPLAQCFSKVQSFGNRENASSPFGSKAFAVAPIDADHETPVALYADCGNNGSLSFESRRVFRTVVEILNQKLPTIPGGIPVELE